MNSIISWIGGKKALRELIYQRFPLSYGRYIEVFGGGGWVLFGKPPDGMEVYNDYNSDLTNLFRCVRDRPLALIQELGFFPLNGREEFDHLKRFLNREEFMTPGPWYQEEGHLAEQCLTPEACGEIQSILEERARMYDVKRAACFYQLIRYSYGSGCTSYGCQPFDIRRTFGLLWEGSRRLAGTVVENKDFEALIRQYDRGDAFFYCDPPYYKTEGHYEVVFRREDHERLRDVLGGIQGKWLLSYNDCSYIRELYEGYQIETVKRLNNLAQRYNHGEEYAEVFISNYDTTDRVRELPEQMELSDVYGFYP
ncbi:MAG: DNA adenine methylase [Enterocloster bolteae]|uniref:DNA adenine methylase n=1 Tax=Enterocloster bolteae TaxID=208479 RepID=UPI0039940D89